MASAPALRPVACACGIDVHSHVVPFAFPAWTGPAAPRHWPAMAPAQDACHRSVMIEGRNYRTVSEGAWSASRRLADLAHTGLGLQLLSPMPELLSYWMPAAAAARLLRYINEQIAQMAAEGGGALPGLGAVPLQDMDLAIAELRHLIENLGLRGVEVGSNINGAPIGAARFDPFFEACESLGAAVFVHALRPAGMDRLVGPAPLEQVLGYPTDVGLAAASVITGNLIERRPGLRIAFSHGGGTLAALLPRLEQGWKVFPALASCLSASPTQQARRLFYDALVFDAAGLRHLVERFGAGQLLLGSDYPFNFRDEDPVGRARAAGLDEPALAGLPHLNAARFLGLDERMVA